MIRFILFATVSSFLSGFNSSNYDVRKEKIIQDYIQSNKDSYEEVKKDVQRIVDEGIRARLKMFLLLIPSGESKVDDLIIFNSDRSKLFTTLNSFSRQGVRGASDLVQGLYGVEIDGEWHIYIGGNLIALRQPYKYDYKTKFTWEEISFVAHEHFQNKYVDIDRKGKIVMDMDRLDKDINPISICGNNNASRKGEREGFLSGTEIIKSQIIDSLEYE